MALVVAGRRPGWRCGEVGSITAESATGGRRAWTVWAVGVAAYIVAVLHRTSLGVAGLDTMERFGASAGVLASFAVLQLLVYAALQVPVGVLIDRVGPRRLVVVGATLMAVGQLVLAVATDLPAAVGARVLVGAGDAMTFISVLRLVTTWFPARRVPVLTQVTGLTGQVGQILSAVPLVALLHRAGWQTAFLAAGSLGVLVAVLAMALLRDAPAAADAPPTATSLAEVRAELASAWRHPGTRLGLWTHFVTQFSGTVFALLWGVPFLVSAQGLSAATASGLLTLFVVVGMVTAPLLGVVVGRHPLRRSWLVLGIAGCSAAAWAVVLSWPGRAPLGLLVGLVVVLAVNGPGSMIAFDYARTFNPPQRQGAATGIVNVGGFVASLTTMLLVGLVLDAVSSGSASTLTAFRVALSVQFGVWAVGVVGVMRTRTLARRVMADDGIVVPPLRQALRRDWGAWVQERHAT